MALSNEPGAGGVVLRATLLWTRASAVRMARIWRSAAGHANDLLLAVKGVVAGRARGALTALTMPALAGLSLAVLGVACPEAGNAQSVPASVAGQLLVATPEMPDPRFAQTVIYMIEHDASGAMGVVINQTLGEIPIGKLLDGLGLDGDGARGSVRLHRGGPVNAASGLVLHSPDYVADGTVVVDHGLALTARPEIVADIASGTGPRHSLVAFGYAGWGPGQLESEIAAGAWITIPSDDALVFDDDDGKWRRAMARWGIDL